MSTSSWDDMKRVREEEFFQREEREKMDRLRAKLLSEKGYIQTTRDAISKYERGFSPLSGKAMYRIEVAGTSVLDCPEEGCVLLSYETLESLLAETRKQSSDVVDAWKQFLGHEATTK